MAGAAANAHRHPAGRTLPYCIAHGALQYSHPQANDSFGNVLYRNKIAIQQY
jgi:hypothetical protein